MSPSKHPDAEEPRRGEPAGRWAALWDRLVWDARFWTAVFLVGMTGLFLLKHAADGTVQVVYEPGEIVRSDVKAPVSFEFRDEERTRAERRAARDNILSVFDFNSKAGRDAVANIRAGFQTLRDATVTWFASLYGPTATGQPFVPPYPLPPPKALEDGSRTAFPQMGDEARQALYRHGFSKPLENWIVSTVENLERSKIAASTEGLRDRERILVRDVQTGAEWEDSQPGRILSVDEARAQVVARGEELEANGLSPAERVAVSAYTASLLRPTLSPNVKETETRRERAAARVPPVVEMVPKGKIIAREGEEVTPHQAALLRSLSTRTASFRDWRTALGFAALAGALLALIAVYLRSHRGADRGLQRKPLFGMFALTTLSTAAVGAMGLFLADAATEALQGSWNVTPDTLRYAVPWAAGAMVLALLADRHVAVFYAIAFSVLMGMYLGGNYPLTLFCLLSGLGGSFAVERYKKRTDAVRASALLGLLNVAIVAILHAFSPWLSGGRWSWLDYLAALAGGASVYVVFHLLVPLLEHAFGILTDVRLLELGDPDNPLLRDLAVRAPGTYQHSMAVGRLAEAAAESIHANSLFCRVAALYHDIGKMRKPEYFIENQRDGVNPHDRLRPHMSTLIIISHVKDGLMMTRRAGVPRPIRDIIPQHHGTRLITYFFKKAGEGAHEAEFRYPGPKPQSREAAIFMLSDGVEAAARTIRNPTSARLKGMIRQVTNAVMLDGQLDQCDLSFKEIGRIQEAFLKILLSMYHGRIDYPGFDFEKRKDRRRDSKIVRFPPKNP